MAATDGRRDGRDGGAGQFESVLLVPGAPAPAPPSDTGFLVDLHLDDLFRGLAGGAEQPDLGIVLVAPLPDADAVAYRQEVFRDLESPGLVDALEAFAAALAQARELAERATRSRYPLEQGRWVLDACAAYVGAVDALAAALDELGPRSRALVGFAAHLAAHRASPAFERLAADITSVSEGLAAVRYTLHVGTGHVAVTRFDGEPDYGAEVAEAFARFQQGDGREFRFPTPGSSEMNHVEAAILKRVALAFPQEFRALANFRAAHSDFADPTLVRFAREIRFYLGYRELMHRFRDAGLPYCYPTIHSSGEGMVARDAYDVALARRLVADGQTVVLNDVELDRAERVIVVSGPNQGGKTTFARVIGQLHHLARIGVPVPGSSVRVQLADAIFCHFEREERVEDLSSKLEEDLRRIRAVLEAATPSSVVVMNESFSSTTLQDQLFINGRVMQALLERGALTVAVTFLDELSTLDPAVVSMVSTVDPDDPARRTFRIVRRPADGLAYAMSIAEKHGLTADQIAARLRP